MYIPQIIKVFLVLIAFSLILFFAIPGSTLMFLIKLFALSTGITILIALFYPRVRGLKKGDVVIVAQGSMPSVLGFGRRGVAIEDGKINDEIKVRLSNGREAVAVVESYGGAFSMPRVRLIYEESIRE